MAGATLLQEALTARREGKTPPPALNLRSAARPLTDVFSGRITLSAEEGKPARSWIQLFPVGKFWDPRYGDFAITRHDLSQMLQNFKSVTPVAPYELPIDYNHGTSNPSTAEKGKAAGWIKDLELRAKGDQLWGLVEWTESAATMIAAKEYQFVSPTFAYNYTHNNGQEIGTTLLAAAITNRPVLEGMAPLTLSQHGTLQLEDVTALPGADADPAAWMYSYDEQRRRVQASLTGVYGVQPDAYGSCGPCGGVYLVDMFDGKAIYREYDGSLYAVPFSIDTAGTVHFTGMPSEVVTDYRALSGEQQMAKTFTVKNAQGQDVVLSEEVVLSLAREITPAAGPSPEMIQLTTVVTELTAKNAAIEATVLDLTARNVALELTDKTRSATIRVGALITAAKVAPADRDELVKMAIDTPLAFDALEKQLQKRPALVQYSTENGSSAEGGSETPTQRVVALAKAAMEKDTKLNMAAATRQVLKDDPALYAAYIKESAIRV